MAALLATCGRRVRWTCLDVLEQDLRDGWVFSVLQAVYVKVHQVFDLSNSAVGANCAYFLSTRDLIESQTNSVDKYALVFIGRST